MEATIGALRVVLGADTAAFEKGLKNAEGRLDKFASNLGKVAAGLGVAMAAATAALAVSMKHAVDEADKLGKAAQSIGIPVEELSRLKHAADLSGVSLEELSKSVGILSKNMVAAADGTGPAADAFRALGISVKNADGSLKSGIQAMEEIADRFGKMQDGAGKTALAMATMGRAGASMIPLLNQGATGLREMMAEADKLGIVIDGKTAQAAEAFNDNLTRLGKVKDGIILKITAGMLPAMQQLSEAMVKTARDGELMKTISDGLSTAIKFAAEIGLTAVVVFQRLAAEINNLVTVAQLLSQLEFSKALEAFRAEGDRTAEAMEALKQRLATLWDVPASELEAKAPDTAAKIAAPIIQSMQKIDAERKKGIALMGEMDKEQADILERFQTPVEKMVAEIDKINDAFARGILTQEQFGRISEIVAQRVINAYASAAANALQTFGQVFAQFGEKNKALFQASKAFSIASAIISAYVGANKALAEYPPPLSFVMAASVVAAGLANVAKIMAQQPPAFAEGGSFRVGGVGGIDSQMVSMRLSPGEMVDVRKGEGASRATELVIPSIRPRDFFTGETVRELLLTIDEWSRDGGRGIRFAT